MRTTCYLNKHIKAIYNNITIYYLDSNWKNILDVYVMPNFAFNIYTDIYLDRYTLTTCINDIVAIDRFQKKSI